MEQYQEILEKLKIPIALILVGIVLILGGIYLTPKPKKEFPKESIVSSDQNQLVVEISGAVIHPGVYKLPDGSRIEDAINLAGGFQNTVNKEYVSKDLNKAQKLIDGIKLYIPFRDEKISGDKNIPGAATSRKINLNTSSQIELESISGIGQATSTKIISNRPYQKSEDLISKKVMSKSVYNKIKDLVTVY